MTPSLDATPDMEAARAAFALFLHSAPPDALCVGLHDTDADGVAAGVVWQRGLERLGRQAVRLLPDRERNAWTEANRALLAGAHPDRLFVLDLGSGEESILPGVPTCFIDHHKPGGVPLGDTLISAYAWSPIPCTSLLMYDLLAPLADMAGLDWVAAVGAVSDLGERAPFDLLQAARKKYTAKYLKEATALVNAVRRASQPDPECAARVLLAFDSPRALVLADTPDVQQLRAARAEVKLAMEEAKKSAPVFAGDAALIRTHSACQIHPLVAQIWRSRLPGHVVIAANDGYLPGRVNFSARSASGRNVLEFLRAIPLPPGEGNIGNGHDQASGGSLPVARWNQMLGLLGFAPAVFAPPRDEG